ncbi:TPA: AAA family ATPase [Pseudomonas aeruginosa]|nr:AAA family ATPase [Pseudomonas aeruginosa]
MRIISFSAGRVHGIYDYNIEFNKGVNFLVGINGSGKTTALRLMQSALSLDFLSISSIKFRPLRIKIEKQNDFYSLAIKSEKDMLSFILNGESFYVKIPPVLEDKYSSRIDEYFESQRLELIRAGSENIQRFVSAGSPLFLGLERRMGRYDDEPYYFSENVSRDYSYRQALRHRRDALEGMDNCQRLIERAYRQYRKVSDGSNSRLMNIIVESTFEYVDFSHENFGRSEDPYREFLKLQERREEIEVFAKSLGGGEKVSNQIDKFFSKVTEVLHKYNAEDQDSLAFEWLLNMAQVKRIHKFLAEMERQKSRAARIYAPIQDFVNTMNEFFRHSRKELEVDSLGRIKIIQNGESIDISTLSSGEKQLLILMAHARFASTRESVFIVDEPELSLHMRWQEMLVEALLRGGRYNQFIFATHSPEIVGYMKEYCIQVG